MADDMIYTAGVNMLACLQVACESNDNPPGSFMFLPGAQATADISQFENLCCPGTAYVRMGAIFPSGSAFPEPDTSADSLKCGPMALGVIVELGIMRCSPAGDVQHVATAAEWSAAFQQQMIDAASMRKAVCLYQSQYAYPGEVIIGSWSPVGPEGGCLIGVQLATISISGCPGC